VTNPGLQAERTQLSWERSSFGFLAVSALALLGHGSVSIGKLTVGAAGVLLAMLTVWLGRRRLRRLADAPRLEVAIIGIGTGLFAALVLIVILL
jgi:hypothetical protein